MLLRANCPASGVPASTPRSSDRCEICCSFKPRFLFFSLSLCLFVNLCFSFSCQPRTLANLGLLPTSDGKQLWERDCIRDVHGVCAFRRFRIPAGVYLSLLSLLSCHAARNGAAASLQLASAYVEFFFQRRADPRAPRKPRLLAFAA